MIDAGKGATAWWPVAVLLDAQASYLLDRDADMVQLCRDAEFATRGSPSAHAVAQAHLALAHFLAGDERRGQRAVAAAVNELAQNRLEHFTLTVLVHAVQSLAAARRHEFSESAVASEATLGLLDLIGVVARTQCLARICLADAALLRGELALAERLVRETGRLLDAEPEAVFLWDGVDRLHAELADLRREQRVVSGVGLTEAELRVLRLLPTHRSLEEIGEALYVSRNTVKTHSVSIYRKLGVSGRSDAVQRARSLGLVDDEVAT